MTDPSSVRVPGPWRHRWVSANGIQLHVVECGRGPLAVLLHGFPEFWWAWRHQLIELANAGFRAVAVDLRGYGESDKPPRGYDLWTLAGDASGLIRALGERKADVIGHGCGGLIGWTLTALHPRLVRSLVVLNTPHPLALRRAVWADPAGQGRAVGRYALGFQLPWQPERWLRADGAAGVERIMRAWSGRGWVAAPEFTEVVHRNRAAMLIPGVAHSALEYYRWAMRSQFRPDGHRFASEISRPIELPVLQVHGADDPYLLERTARESDRWAHHRAYRVLSGCGHFPHQEAPHATTRLITDFLGGPG
ncbi:MAG: alpha/beta hydrolase [Pseudonocardia sp.]|nr:alpha/beta hydrolase [Pseudonocardia sp.]